MRAEKVNTKHETTRRETAQPETPQPPQPEATSKLAQDVKQVIENVGETLSDEVDVIDERLGDATDSLPSNARQIAMALGAGLAFIAGGTWWAMSRRRTRSRRLWRARGLALQRMWRQPELVARPHQSVLAKAGKGLAATAITLAVKKAGIRLLETAWREDPGSR